MDGVQHKADVEDMKCYISTAWNKRDYDNNWQTKSANLQHQSEIKLFSDTIVQSNKDILKSLDYNVEDIIITDMWANVLKPYLSLIYFAQYPFSLQFIVNVFDIPLKG